MTPEQHFDRLVELMPKADRAEHDAMKHVRIEDGFQGRTFYLYEMVGREPEVLDQITVEDFVCNERVGASIEVRNSAGKILEISYTPVRLFDRPVFMFLPLHGRVRWSTTPSKPLNGSLAFPLGIRTKSRMHLRERGVVHCETGVVFDKEFNKSIA